MSDLNRVQEDTWDQTMSSPQHKPLYDSGDSCLHRVVAKRLLNGERIFLTGGAGTGKTYFLGHVLRNLANTIKRSSPDAQDRVIVTASTGLAATHLWSAMSPLQPSNILGPFTLHSAALLPWSEQKDQEWERGKQRLRNVKVVVIDEISMLDRTTFDRFIRRLSKDAGILAVGDFFQLPPIRRDDSGEPEFPFWSRSFRDFRLLTLGVNYRQSEPDFLKHLLRLRHGSFDVSFYESVPTTFDLRFPVMFGTNREVDQHNQAQIRGLPSRSVHSIAKVELGDEQNALEWFTNHTRARIDLELKIGMRVMCIQNHRIDGQMIANGDIGEVLDFDEPDSSGLIKMVLVRMDRNGEFEFQPYRFEEKKFDGDKEFITRMVSQIPLIPAYALTVHKCQGMSLDLVNIDASKINFAPGQAYVAVSRCRTKEGLRIRNAEMFHCYASDSVRSYYSRAPRLRISGDEHRAASSESEELCSPKINCEQKKESAKPVIPTIHSSIQNISEAPKKDLQSCNASSVVASESDAPNQPKMDEISVSDCTAVPPFVWYILCSLLVFVLVTTVIVVSL